jgi:hypothetical protein
MASIVSSLVGVLLFATLQARSPVQPRCGADRWPVKTLTDLDRDQVSLTAVTTTIRLLTSIPIPQVPYPADRRLAPQELTTYAVRGRLIARFVEADQDVHLVLEDPDATSVTMIAEVPLAACAHGSLLESKLSAVRRIALDVPIHSVLTVTGVGFFDFIHTTRGQAPNGFELHPAFAIAIVSNTTPRH